MQSFNEKMETLAIQKIHLGLLFKHAVSDIQTRRSSQNSGKGVGGACIFSLEVVAMSDQWVR